MRSKKVKSVFELLAKPVQKALAQAGFAEPTLPQTLAFSPVLEGKNVLLIAPTGTGKTEAVLLPVFSNLIKKKSQNEKMKGIQVIYITPLRALNRDMLKRLTFWSQQLGISVEVRHGDTEMKVRRKQAQLPPQMLVTTPETLQAILPGSQMRRHLASVECVIVDEVHDLAESKRGVQLALALERLFDAATHEFQRIGLSATVGNPAEVAKFIAGTNREVSVIQAVLAKNYRYKVEFPTPTEEDYELAGKLETAPEAAARIRTLTRLIDTHKSTLVFVNSRTMAEMLGHRFSQLNRTDIAVHHGSLSREERVNIEDSFKAGTLKAIIATSTLELGIDIGNVDLVVQYMSPRQVSSLIQRVGRSGHSLKRLSEGVIITVYPDDTLESVAAVENAQANKIEAVRIHENALDVLAHQTAGILMDKQTVPLEEAARTIRRAYPYRTLSESQLLDVVHFLESLHKIRLSEEDKVLRKTGRTREYYYNNLSMIPDERRYPVVNVLSDRKIGTLGDEFMALDARVGLHFIMRGKVWRIVQIEEETGTVHVVPAEDPFAAIPGWDGEILPVPFSLAQQTGIEREKIGKLLKEAKPPKQVAKELAAELKTDPDTLLETIKEIDEHQKEGAPLPTQNRILLEAYDRYLIVHACFGEGVNRTLAGVFDSVLSEREVITGWWTDGYRILVEAPRKLSRREVEELPKTLFCLSDEQVDAAFGRYVKAKFPFAPKMKAVAERFGALPRGKTMSYERLATLRASFENTPIYEETLREAMLEKADLPRAKQVMRDVQTGKIEVRTLIRGEKPTPLAYHILAQYADVSELMAPERVILSNIDRMKNALDARTATLLCMNCGVWMTQIRVRDLPLEPNCANCGSRLLTLLYPRQDAEKLKADLQKRREGTELGVDDLKELSVARRKADLVLSYGKQAVRALMVKGVGPETASRILGKMHPKEEEFYVDLLKAKIQYLRTREFWDDKDKLR
ncbi:MAG: DEAD/DEAH box helicase [Candidatus Bathyarchaeota archaeon]|nr:DEAD/DEAH box helicase [Candidatus Bathyarchaeota archaeon]